MTKQRILWMSGGALLAVILFFIGTQLLTSIQAAEPLTEEGASEMVLERYPDGDIKVLSRQSSGYTVEFEISSGLYEMKINKDTGEIESLKVIENTAEQGGSTTVDETPSKDEILTEDEVKEIAAKHSNGELTSFEMVQKQNSAAYEAVIKDNDKVVTLLIDPSSGEIISETTEITEAKNPVPITEDKAKEIALTEVTGTVDDVELEQSEEGFYFLVEIETGDDREAIVQINAISGNVMSTTWDD
ncbi:PepSY domain-containing protein [Jeotgalibacillus proteolyticus]|uniref:PepSY domain-containing protein n=1 Tax=Jeotgalibacillus proteolyticus TaxID=2082395 RepID=A0A2S5GHD2_9BACL|nr:PepSY domain-containing protein [Jeotgalibacillus proteolyticus]PPA72263.1 hypothetical protein C4B60_02470 [Jeotgalibacillus proteolyticus]